MATGAKRTADSPEELDVEGAVAEVAKPAPDLSARPNDTPIKAPFVPNTTFAQRAKASGGNKRVDATASESK